MRTFLSAVVALLGVATLRAQGAQPSAPIDPVAIMAVQPGETVIMPTLKSVVLLTATPASAAAWPTGAPGVDATRVPLLDTDVFRRELAPFLNHPASFGSLNRLQSVIRLHLQFLGRPLASVSLPPQDVTDGTVRIVVQLATLEGGPQVSGARWFSESSYANAVHAKGDETLDMPAIQADVAWLNRNPFRRVSASAEAGSQRGTTRLVLNTQEKLPLELSAGYNNTGTAITDEQRVSAGVLWGNALGRGDLARYNYSADPASRHLRSHSGSYTAFLPWRHVLTVQAAWSHLTPDMPAPFVQDGTSWQVGARYEVPLPAPHPGWTQELSFTADFKYSDNTLEFAAVPITGNTTHVAQFGANYSVGFAALGGRVDLYGSAVVSPGNLTARNDDLAFAGSRPGAKARYAYAKLGARLSRPLGHGFSFTTTLDAQLASAALLGSEQLGGTGAYAVRGYRENGAFGDWGVVASQELHAPGFSPLRGRDNLDVFGFVDFASLNLNVDHESTELGSAGLGANYQFGRHLSVRAAYGWQLKDLDRATEKAHGHVSVALTW